MFNMVRDGKKVWPTCPECGCRFNVGKMSHPSWNDEGYTLSHFYDDNDESRDARGCLCSLIEQVFIGYKGTLAAFF